MIKMGVVSFFFLNIRFDAVVIAVHYEVQRSLEIYDDGYELHNYIDIIYDTFDLLR